MKKKILLLAAIALLCSATLDAKPARKTAKKATTTKLTKNNRSTEFTPTGSHGGHDYVDLGLPSGTLWATTNIGANSPEEFGDYFAWGETSPKSSYDWSNYKWCDGSEDKMTKYCANSSYGTVDNKKELDFSDDAAYVNWGPGWRMPSYDQLVELWDKCKWTRTTRNGVKGYKVSRNGKSLFLPAASYRDDLCQSLAAGSDGDYWSREFLRDYPSVGFLFSLKFCACDSGFRYCGRSVRAVRSSN